MNARAQVDGEGGRHETHVRRSSCKCRRDSTFIRVLTVLTVLACAVASEAASPFPTRENLLKPLGPGAEAALKKYAEQADPLLRKTLTDHMNGVVKKIGKAVRLETGEAEKLKLAAKEVIDSAAKAWQPRVVESLRYLLPPYGTDSAQANRVGQWRPDQIVPQYTVQGWQIPDRTPAWQATLKTVLGDERLALWTKADATSHEALNEQTTKFLQGWANKGREPMDQELRTQVASLKKVLKLPQEKMGELESVAKKLVDDHVAAELIVGAELMASVLDEHRLIIMAKQNAIAKRFVRPPREELETKWIAIAGKLLGEPTIAAWKKGAAEQKVAEQKAAAPPAKIRWNNGESIAGELLDGTADAVRWKTPLFGEPLELKWHALRRFDQSLAAVQMKEPFSIAMRDGSHILGDVVELTDKSILVRSARHGDVALKRAEVTSIRRLRGNDLVVAGPVGDVGWDYRVDPTKRSSTPAVTAIPTLVTGAGGSLVIPYWNRRAVIADAIPESADVEFHVSSSARPDFRLSLECGTNYRLEIETWDDELVLTSEDEFQFIRKLTEKERAVGLRVCWDRITLKCSVFTPAGELITEWQTPPVSVNGPTRLVLQNKGRDVALEFLRVRKWDGKPPPKCDVTQPRLELADGGIVEGEVIRGNASSLRVRLKGQASEQDMPLGAVDAIFISGDQPKLTQTEATLNYADGTYLAGKIDSIKDGSVAVRTSFADAPVKSKVDALRQIMIEVPSPDGKPPQLAIVDMDGLVFPSASLHGKLVADGTYLPKWLPIGGVKPASLKGDVEYVIKRAFPAGSKLPTAPALFFTSSGDILPGTLTALNRGGVEIESEIMDGRKLPPETLTAIQFGEVKQTSIKGFGDPGWRIIKGDKESVRIEKDGLGMDEGTSVGHVAAMQGSEIKMSMAYSGFSTVRLRLFCAGLEAGKTSNLMISHWGSYVYSGLETGDGQLADQMRTGVEQGKPLVVKLLVQEKSVELHLNGVLAQKFPIASSARQGAGLIIEPASLWGNSVNPVSLSAFSSRSVPGQTWLPDVSAETKMQALTVPRFRRDDPALHAIIAANGDVLRGEIEAVSVSHFGFRSGLETLRVPRDRVKAAVWLKKPIDGAQPSSDPSPTQKLLAQTIGRRMRYSSGDFRSLISAIEREAAGLKIKMPAKEDSRRFPFQFGGQTISDALEQVCALFGMRYRLDKDGTVVIEEAPVVPKGLVQRSHWVKAGAFMDKPSAQEVLTAKGVPFPGGASAVWRADAGQLTMTNTLENQAKLVEVLAKDFGGSQGSPTHWLQLTSGAQLALTVEKFEADLILGRHPTYGACRVPMAQVYVIRTSMPEPTTTMNFLQDWRLVYAQEPVLPETGGESSPLLTKPAPLFKLPLLGGGEFDLAQEKGKVVVLDFWATWCGPCIKSLPGLIEAMSAFPSDKVKLIGANQGEGGEVVKRFLEARNLKLTVAMDGTQSVARQYGVDGIPHTVIIGSDGKVAWVKTGYSPDGHTEAAEAVKQLLAKP